LNQLYIAYILFNCIFNDLNIISNFSKTITLTETLPDKIDVAINLPDEIDVGINFLKLCI